MLPLNDIIFSNPAMADIPIRIVLGVLFLMLFVVAIRYGPKGAVDVAGRFRWVFVAAIVPAAVWGLYAYSVLHPASGWVR